MKKILFKYRKLSVIPILYLAWGILLSGMTANAQTIKPQGVYTVVLENMEGNRVRGFLIAADSLGITLNISDEIRHFAPAHIMKIRINKKGAIIRGLGLGFLAGAIVGGGGALFLAKDDKEPDNLAEAFVSYDQSKEQKVLTASIVAGGIGAIIGGATARKRFYVKGDKERYRHQLAAIKEFLVYQSV